MSCGRRPSAATAAASAPSILTAPRSSGWWRKQGIDGIFESKRAREACCDVRKTRPLDRALSGAAAWITGLRADQNDNRRDAGFAAFDGARGLLKVNPLYDWTREAVLAETQRRACRSTRCTPRALPRSAARPARARSSRANRNATAAGGGKPTATRNAACICRARRAGNDNLTPRPRRDEPPAAA